MRTKVRATIATLKFLSIKTREVNYSPFNANTLTYNN